MPELPEVETIKRGLEQVIVGKRIEEIRVRAAMLRVLQERGMRDIKDITLFCRRYHSNRNQALEELGLSREDLLRRP